MKKMNSDALGILNKSLGLTGAGSRITELADGIVDQSIDIVPAVRRGRTLAKSGGIFTATLRNIHVGGTDELSQAFPYEVVPADVRPPYPSPMPAQFDIWLLGCSVTQISGTSTLSGALLILYPTAQIGWGEDSAGAPIVADALIPVAFWDSIRFAGAIALGMSAGSGQLYRAINLRLPRSTNLQLQFRTRSNATSTYDCDMILGVFPVALGQDGVV